MNLTSIKKADLQNCLALLTIAEGEGVTDSRFLRERIQRHIDSDARKTAIASGRYRRANNITTCGICGSQAVILPVNSDAGTLIGEKFTHVVQCQNRPAADKPWLPKHCGHSEYIVRGDR